MNDDKKPPQYAPPPGAPPSGEPQYAPPPGLPPPPAAGSSDAPAYAAPPDGPPPSDEKSARAESPPAYTHTALHGDRVLDRSQPTLVSLTLPTPSPSHLPLDPPPALFTAPTPLRIRSASFAAFRVPSRTASLADGFAPLYAPSALEPHGVPPEDWARFLTDLHHAAQLARQGISAVAPYRSGLSPKTVLRSGLGVLTGPRAAAGGPYDKAFGKTPVQEVQSLIDVWQGSAFERRKLRVTIHQRIDAEGRQREGYDLLVEAL